MAARIKANSPNEPAKVAAMRLKTFPIRMFAGGVISLKSGKSALSP